MNGITTERLGFTDREMRDKEYRRLKAEGKKHVMRYTTHEKHLVRVMSGGAEVEVERYNPQIIYVVAWPEMTKITVKEAA